MAIIHCTCQDEGQDKLHGVGKRVGNKTASVPSTWRCTKCLREVPESHVVRK